MRNRWVTHSNAAAFQAVVDPTRRAVLDLLRRGSLPAGAIARAFPVSRPAISRHLRVLRRARLVEEGRSGRHRIYRLNADPLKGVDRWLEAYREFWNSKLRDLKNFLEGEASKADAGRQGRKRRADSRARRKVK